MNKLVVSFFLTISVFASEIDYLAISSTLIKNGNYLRARKTLNKAKNDFDEIDSDYYYLLNGLLYLRTNNLDRSFEEFLKIEGSEYSFKKNTYLSELSLLKEDYQKAMDYIDLIKIEKSSPKSIVMLKAKVYFLNKKIKESFDLLNQISELKKTRKIIVDYLFQLKLEKEAFSEIGRYLKDFPSASSYLIFAKYLFAKKKLDLASIVLEDGSLRFSKNEEILKMLASVYQKKGYAFIASDLYTKLSYLNPSYAFMAAEFLKRSHRPVNSMVLNMNIADPKKKLTQKLFYYLENEKFDMAMSLSKKIKQYKGLESDDVKYAMAYTDLIFGNYEKAKGQLKHIKKESLIVKSVKLLDVVNECQESGWVCFGTF